MHANVNSIHSQFEYHCNNITYWDSQYTAAAARTPHLKPSAEVLKIVWGINLSERISVYFLFLSRVSQLKMLHAFDLWLQRSNMNQFTASIPSNGRTHQSHDHIVHDAFSILKFLVLLSFSLSQNYVLLKLWCGYLITARTNQFRSKTRMICCFFSGIPLCVTSNALMTCVHKTEFRVRNMARTRIQEQERKKKHEKEEEDKKRRIEKCTSFSDGWPPASFIATYYHRAIRSELFPFEKILLGTSNGTSNW